MQADNYLDLIDAENANSETLNNMNEVDVVESEKEEERIESLRSNKRNISWIWFSVGILFIMISGILIICRQRKRKW